MQGRPVAVHCSVRPLRQEPIKETFHIGRRDGVKLRTTKYSDHHADPASLGGHASMVELRPCDVFLGIGTERESSGLPLLLSSQTLLLPRALDAWAPLPAWHSADNAPAIVRRSCPSPWAWSNGSGRRAGDSATPWRAAGEVS